MTGPTLLVEDVSFSFGSKPVLSGVGLRAGRGEVVGIIGPNGSGKTTLMRVISTVLKPRQGRVLIDGRDAARLSRGEVARKLAVVPQSPHVPGSFTAWEVVLLGRTPHLRLFQSEGPRDYEVVHRSMELTDTRRLAHRRIGELSGGELQRVIIARALAQEPIVLLLDEPTSHLDVNHQMAVMDLVVELNRRAGLAVLVVFHDLNLAAQYCHRLAILRDGRVLAEGRPDEVITPANIAAAYGAALQVVPHPDNGLPMVVVTGHHWSGPSVGEPAVSIVR